MGFYRFVISIFTLLFVLVFSLETTLAASGSKAGNRKISKSFAAISYSKKTGSYGYVTKETSKRGAKRRAKQECGKHASDCRTVAWTNQQCLALATDPSGGYGANWGNSRNHAQTGALRGCRSHRSNKECKLAVTICQ